MAIYDVDPQETIVGGRQTVFPRAIRKYHGEGVRCERADLSNYYAKVDKRYLPNFIVHLRKLKSLIPILRNHLCSSELLTSAG